MLALSAYSLRHHFTALLLTLPLVTVAFSASNSGDDVYKAIGFAAFLVAAVYYLFLYKYKAMLAVGLIVSSIVISLGVLYFISRLVFLPCGFNPCSLPAALDNATSKASSWAGALVLLNVILIVVYVFAGVGLGLRERRA